MVSTKVKDAIWIEPLREFAAASDLSRSFLALDLDGTALLEDRGKVFISSSVENGVKAIHDLKLPIVLNTLRFPLSVINTIGEAWYQIADAPILTVLLNGSILGYIKRSGKALHYEELAAFPLGADDIRSMIQGINQLISSGIDDLLVFFYSRNWQEGEALWTPRADKVVELQKKYVSASRVLSGTPEMLAEELFKREICMTTLFINRPSDTLMAYQHTQRNSFFTARGVNKASGLKAVASLLKVSPLAAIGAGDTEMDTFLNEVGFAVIVGQARLSFRGRQHTVRVESPMELGDLILAYADLIRSQRPA